MNNSRDRRTGTSDVGTIPLRVLLRGADAMLACGGALLRVLPEEKALPLAPLLGLGLRWAQKRRALAHMKEFLRHDDWSAMRWEQLWKAHLAHLGHTIREVYYWSRLPQEQVVERVTIEGREHLDEALRAGRGVLAFANHLGNFFSFWPAASRAGWKVFNVRNPMPLSYLDHLCRCLAGRFGGREGCVGTGVPALAAQTFRENSVLFLFVDYSQPDERNVWLPFGRSETRVSLGPALLAIRHRVPVLCITCERMDAMRHRVVVHPPLSTARSGHAKADALELTQSALNIVAEDVRRHPEQWWPWDWVPIRAPHVASDLTHAIV